MYLTSLEISGFKSFAKRTVLTFEPGVTAVVGPNGSGKSNIADAIRWVLGAQSKKAVRGRVATDVIFSGTSSKAAMGLAEVSLTFDNTDRKLPYEFDEVVVTRRLYRSGDSEYLVGGTPVRLGDLQHALAVAGIGAENYTVISQGMVDRTLSQSPYERRSLFEEAAGVRQFYLKRDEARRKLRETATNLARVEDILKELEPRLKTLRRQAHALAQAEETKEKLQQAYLALYGHRHRERHAEWTDLTAKRDDANRELMAVARELETGAAELTELRQRQQGMKLNELLAERDTLRNRRDAWQQQLHQALTDREVATVQKAALESTREQLETLRAELVAQTPSEAPPSDPASGQRLGSLQKKLTQIDQEYTALKESLKSPVPAASWDDFARDLEAVVGELDRAITAEASYARLGQLMGRLRKLSQSVGAKSGESTLDHQALERTSDLLVERDRIQQELQQLMAAAAAQAEVHRLHQENDTRRQQEIVALEKRLAGLKDELKTLEKRLATETKTIDETSASLRNHQREYAKLEAAITAEQQQGLGDVGALEKLEQAVQEKRRTQEAYRQELNLLNVDLAKCETRLDALVAEAKTKLGGSFPPAAGARLPDRPADLESHISTLERRLFELGAIDQAVTEEHQEVGQRFAFLSTQADDLRRAKDDLERVITQLERKSQTLFRESFTAINQEFGTFFARLFDGGKASLKLIEERGNEPGDSESGLAEAGSDAPAQFGIDIAATPPGKRLTSLAMLSGGERALTSVALLFAILKVNPSPFVMLDEVDAALDEANTARFAELLATLQEQTQFLVVTHNRDTMKAARMLYGVTMDETGISTLLSIKLPEAEKIVGQAKQEQAA